MNPNQSLEKLRIFAASPSDVANERTRLTMIVEELRSLAEHVGVTLELVDWRKVVPDLSRPEQIILDQLQPTTWDVFIGILWHRFGTPTRGVGSLTGQEYLSGTEEEFRLAHHLWEQHKRPHIMFYWCKRNPTYDELDPEQFRRVKDFFAGFAPDAVHPGLYQIFDSIESFERLVRQNLSDFLIDYSKRERGYTISPQEVQLFAPRILDTLPRRQPFFGREEEIVIALRALSPEDRGWGLVVDGIGGIGKSALAIEVAHICKERSLFNMFLFVTAKRERLEPSGIQKIHTTMKTLDGLINEIARVLGQSGIIELSNGEQKQRALLDALRGKRALLIFDNLETLTPIDQNAISEFLRNLPQDCKAITTSRRRTGEAAVTLRLEKLKWEEAQQLFKDQIVSDPDIRRSLTHVDEMSWKKIYEEAGGSPLAMLWIIGLIRARGISLERALILLHDGAAESELNAFMYREARKKMGASERMTLFALSLFRKPATFRALELVVNLERPALETALERLHALSLIDLIEEGELVIQGSFALDPDSQRFHVLIFQDIEDKIEIQKPYEERYDLHPLTRRFALADLSTDAEMEYTMGMRFANYWLDYVRNKCESVNRETCALINFEWENFNVATEWLWKTVAMQSVLIANKDAAEMLINIVCKLWKFMCFNGRQDENVRLNKIAYELASKLYIWDKAGLHAYRLAWVHNYQRQIDESVYWINRCLETCMHSNNKCNYAAIKQMQGLIAIEQQKYDDAEHFLKEALIICRDLGGNSEIASVFNSLGGLARKLNNYDESERYFQQARVFASKDDDKEGQAVYRINLGDLALERKRYSEARKLFDEALLLARKVGRKDLLADAQYGIAMVLKAQGKCDDARAPAETALAVYEKLQDPDLEVLREMLKK